ncbi:TPA: hypothetical protein OUB70_002259 [Enterococcus faecalis]|nr:hypothetical protein [Enterococcus faecalis]
MKKNIFSLFSLLIAFTPINNVVLAVNGENEISLDSNLTEVTEYLVKEEFEIENNYEVDISEGTKNRDTEEIMEEIYKTLNGYLKNDENIIAQGSYDTDGKWFFFNNGKLVFKGGTNLPVLSTSALSTTNKNKVKKIIFINELQAPKSMQRYFSNYPNIEEIENLTYLNIKYVL